MLNLTDGGEAKPSFSLHHLKSLGHHIHGVPSFLEIMKQKYDERK